MSIVTLAIFCLPTCNLPWFMDITFHVPISIALYSIGLYFHHSSHTQLGIIFALAPPLHSFWSCFSTDLQWHIGHLPIWVGEFIFQCTIFMPFHTVHILITWTTALSNSRKLWPMTCRATQDGQVIMESSDKMWSTGEGNGKPLQYSFLENSMNSMKRCCLV